MKSGEGSVAVPLMWLIKGTSQVHLTCQVKENRLVVDGLAVNCSLFSHSSEDDDVCQKISLKERRWCQSIGQLTSSLITVKRVGDFLANFTLRNLDVVLGIAIVLHKRKVSIAGDIQLLRSSVRKSFIVMLRYADKIDRGGDTEKTHKLVFATRNVGNIHVMSGWRQVLVLAAVENVKGDDMNLGVAVLASLGGGHVDNLAWTALDNDVAVLAESRALLGKGMRRAGIGGLESQLMLL